MPPSFASINAYTRLESPPETEMPLRPQMPLGNPCPSRRFHVVPPSIDGGTTWKRLEGHGLPSGIWGRSGISVSGGDSSRVYALIEAKDGGIYRSDDGGDSWTRVNDDERYRQRAWYFTHIFADPKAVDTVYVLNTGLFRSVDGAKTFSLLPAPHGDHHGLWIDPTNPKSIINSNDGGATISVDGGNTWSTQG